MGSRGWTSFLFDSDGRQRGDINHLLDAEDAIAGDLSTLQRRVAVLRALVYELSVTNMVAFRMLREGGHLDTDVLKYRVEAELEELKALDTGSVVCAICACSVPPRETVMTADGPVCDRCAP